MGTDKHVCPTCGRAVPTVVTRRKTLGAYVPVWGPGPCGDPECAAYETDGSEAGRSRHEAAHGRHGRSHRRMPGRGDGAPSGGGNDRGRSAGPGREGGPEPVVEQHPEAPGDGGPKKA
ncbi:hypothetical protein GCM10010358_07660 [Streptomyces minutiscleroticus]|uniref:Uncharacterized protein n=1 Tax=Streptomyces minutiscleroticus TaxID=68238 RepID=A0A918K9R0_9ACTN|nr:hypothetical protein [Streptomyces minutiscleroticus]GGX56210.1 hypothetical protein GCM10010358_07660 [Streptomyces minutiscleroticus]